ncbi:sulfate permease [Microbacterium rhizosphaerae]|uniref:Sulfate permease n=1 Tax=Microbacterium rhizosphaerae TaxID=1678237 RepID=A0ABZ0SQ74_9MICO|nr:sulfate permease [Microbacterium rhizosphaerae]WPR91313.1 sulfate permease [Microbacterium rhizosphaerae]
MFALIWMLSIRLRSFLRRFMPTNILLAAIFTRRGLKWGMLTAPLAILYLVGAALCAGLVREGAPGWINLLVLLFLWNAAKFAFAGPLSLVWLIRVRTLEGRARRIVRLPVASDRAVLERITRSQARVLH